MTKPTRLTEDDPTGLSGLHQLMEKPMSSKRKDRTKADSGESKKEPGLTELENGSWNATAGSPPNRQQFNFETKRDARDWRAAAQRHLKVHGQKLTKDAWESARMPVLTAAPAPSHSPTLVSKTVESMLDDVTKYLVKSRRTNTAEDVTFKSNVLRRFLAEEGLLGEEVHTLLPVVGEDYAAWVHEERYEQTTQAALVNHARRVWARAIKERNTTENPFADIHKIEREPSELDRRDRPRIETKAGALTAQQLVAIAFLLRPAYRLAFWLYVLAGLRRSEGLGLTLGCWNPDTSDLQVKTQRLKTAKKGSSRVKTPTSRRPIKLCSTIASLLDAYIEEHHGRRPSDPTQAQEWDRTYLFVGVHGGAMNQQTFCDNVRNACLKLGIDPIEVGKYSPLHQLRGFLTALLLGPAFSVSGRAVSILLGHKVAMPVGANPAANTTREYYTPAVAGEIEQLADRVEEWVQEELLPLADGDLLHARAFDDGVDLAAAAHMLSIGDEQCGVRDVESLIQQGALRAVQNSFTGTAASQALLVSADEVNRYVAERIAATADTYSHDQAALLLGTDRDGLLRMVNLGILSEPMGDPRRRVAARGFRTGSLPGGGRRFSKAEVDARADADSEHIDRRRHWLTIGEAALQIGESESTVRRRADAGEICMWRDPLSVHDRRLLEPVSVAAYRDAVAQVSVVEAAEMLGVPIGQIRGDMKMGTLTRGTKPGHVLRSSVVARSSTLGQTA